MGHYLKEAGFGHVTGVDVSSKMLEQAKDRYESVEKIKLCQDDYVGTIPHYLRNTYDFVTAAGLVNNNFQDEKLFEQMLICCKNQGYLVFAARYSFLGQYWYVDKIAELEKAGRIKFISEKAFFKYDQLDLGVGRFSKTPVKVYVYQKTEEDSIMAGMRHGSSHTVSTVASEQSLSHRD